MKEVFMTVNSDSRFYKDYFAWRHDCEQMIQIAKEFFANYGIESNEFAINKCRLTIEPTESDKKLFGGQLRKDGRSFNLGSEINKAWQLAMKDFSHTEKPRMAWHMHFVGRFRERLFHIDDVLYCRVETDGEGIVPDFCTEIKGSDFYAAIEKEERAKDEE